VREWLDAFPTRPVAARRILHEGKREGEESRNPGNRARGKIRWALAVDVREGGGVAHKKEKKKRGGTPP